MHGKRMTVFTGERDRWKHRPLYLAILEYLKAQGCAGATVTKGIAGFGAHSHIKTSLLVEVSVDLPIVITVVDRPERIEAFAEHVAGMLSAGTITIEDAEVQFYSAAFRGGIPDVTVAEVMTRSVETVTAETPVVELVRKLLERNHTALPVLDADGRVVGVVADQDLLRGGLTSASLSLHKAADRTTVADVLHTLHATGTTVGTVMTTAAVTILDTAPLRDAAQLMHTRGLKRIPVVDERGCLVGVVSRLDVLSSIAAGYARRTAPHTQRLPQEHRRVAEIMDHEVPTVVETTPLGDVVEKLLGSDAKRVMVVDGAQRLVGVIADTDILGRVDPGERPGVFTLLRSRWNRDAERKVRRAYGQRAADVMSSPPVAVERDASVMEALTLSVTKHLKRLPVVDADGRVVGIVSRPALLAASLDLVASPSPT
jgi:CBS domain-containing protein